MRKLIKITLFFLLFVNFFYVFSGAIHYPLSSIDVYSIWLFKAKAFWVSDGFPSEFLRSHLYSHPQYPIFLPWLFYQVYKIVGGVKEMYVIALYPFIYLAILLVAYKFFLEIKLGKLTSLFSVYIYSMLSPLLAQGGRMHAGTADIILVLINWVIVYLAFLIFVKRKTQFYYAVVAMVMVASQIKTEGVFISLLLLLLPIERKRKILGFLISIVPSICWLYLVRVLKIPSDFGLFIPSLDLIIKRFFLTFALTAKEMLNIRNWYIFWVPFGILLFIQKNKSGFLGRVLEPTVILAFLMFVGIYLTATIDTQTYVSSSIDRVFLQLSPFFFPIFAHRTKLFLNRFLTGLPILLF